MQDGTESPGMDRRTMPPFISVEVMDDGRFSTRYGRFQCPETMTNHTHYLLNDTCFFLSFGAPANIVIRVGRKIFKIFLVLCVNCTLKKGQMLNCGRNLKYEYLY